MISIRAGFFFPDASRSRLRGAQTLIDAVKLASSTVASDLHQPGVSRSEPLACEEHWTGPRDQCIDSTTGFETDGEPRDLPGPLSEHDLGFGFGYGFSDDMTLEELKFYKAEDLSNRNEPFISLMIPAVTSVISRVMTVHLWMMIAIRLSLRDKQNWMERVMLEAW